MTELSFLIDLLVNHKLSKEVKGLVVARIKEIETRAPHIPTAQPRTAAPPLPAHLQGQAPSTIANLLKEPGASIVPQVSPVAVEPVINPEQIAVTPAAAQALAARQALLNSAISGKPEPGRTSPRKF